MSRVPDCTRCRKPFGSPVAFCPFCGAAQGAAVVAPPVAVEPAVPAPSPWTVPPVARPAPRPVPVMVPPVVVPPAVVRPPPARRGGWLGYALFGLMALGAVIAVLRPGSTGTVTAHVRGPAGAVTSGHILVDGHPAGTPEQPLTLSAGPHTLVFEEPGYRADPAAVTLRAGETVTAEIVARELPARLALVTTPPGAVIRVMGRSLGTAPTTLELTPGPYDLTLSLGGYVSKTVPVRLARGESRALSVDLAAVAPPPPRFAPPPFDRGVVVAGGALLAAPGAGADVADALPPFSDVQVLAQVVTDDTWLQLRAGSRQGFMRAGMVDAWSQWAQRNAAAGPIDGMTPTMRLVLAGRPYTLFGVQAPDPSANTAGLARMQASLANLLYGTQARCVPADPLRFQCKTAEGRDVAEMYLLNGAAITGEGALGYYAEAQRAARDKQKGMWAP